MASSGDKSLDLAYLVAALVAENDGSISVSEDWFTTTENPFVGSRLKLTNENGVITIELEEEN